MRVVTWNLNRATCVTRGRCQSLEEHGWRAWSELAALQPDVAFIQEAPPPPAELDPAPVATLPAGTDRSDWRSLPGPQRWWCSALGVMGTGP